MTKVLKNIFGKMVLLKKITAVIFCVGNTENFAYIRYVSRLHISSHKFNTEVDIYSKIDKDNLYALNVYLVFYVMFKFYQRSFYKTNPR